MSFKVPPNLSHSKPFCCHRSGIGCANCSRKGFSDEGMDREDAQRGMLGAERPCQRLSDRVNPSCQQHGTGSAGDRSYLSWARAAVTAGCTAHSDGLCVGEIRPRRCAAAAPRWPLAAAAPPAVPPGWVLSAVGWSGHSRALPAHKPGPLSAKWNNAQNRNPLYVPPARLPSRAFCYFYQERGDFLFSFFLPPVRRKDPKCRAQGRALLRIRAVTRGTCHRAASLVSSAHTALAFSCTCCLGGNQQCAVKLAENLLPCGRNHLKNILTWMKTFPVEEK